VIAVSQPTAPAEVTRPGWRRSALVSVVAIAGVRLLLLLVGLGTLAWHPFGNDEVKHRKFNRASAPAALDMWARWDSEWYLDIAAHGYSSPLDGDTYDMRPNFFPAYPLAIRTLTPVLGSPVLAGIVISNAALLLALTFLHAGTWSRVSLQAADRVVWLYAIAPTSFFLSAVYSESLALAALTGAWLAADRGRWTLSGSCLAVAVWCRPIAVFAIAALAWKGLREVWQTRGGSGRLALLIAPPLVAGILYCVFAHIVFGDAFATVRTQAATRTVLTWPWMPFVRAVREGLYWNDYYASLGDAVLAVGAVLSLPFVFSIVGIAEGLLACGVVVFPLASGFTSLSRLLLPAFPLFMLGAATLSGWRFAVVVGVAMAIQLVMFASFVSWRWIA
jgi:hypothetical protein